MHSLYVCLASLIFPLDPFHFSSHFIIHELNLTTFPSAYICLIKDGPGWILLCLCTFTLFYVAGNAVTWPFALNYQYQTYSGLPFSAPDLSTKFSALLSSTSNGIFLSSSQGNVYPLYGQPHASGSKHSQCLIFSSAQSTIIWESRSQNIVQ